MDTETTFLLERALHDLELAKKLNNKSKIKQIEAEIKVLKAQSLMRNHIFSLADDVQNGLED